MDNYLMTAMTLMNSKSLTFLNFRCLIYKVITCLSYIVERSNDHTA